MNKTLILHHYEISPYAEKIRLMFGLTNASWQSVLVPVQPPRPDLDRLTGGYRRIPVAQLGADIFCDTAVIAREIADATGCKAVDPRAVDTRAAALIEQAEKEAFFAAVSAVPPLRLIGTLLRLMGPVGMYRFVKDRVNLLKGGAVRPAWGSQASAVLRELLDSLETILTERPWVGGDSPSVADLATYHPLWLHASVSRSPLSAGPKIEHWYQRVGEIGYGSREDISGADALAAARDTEPRPLPVSVDDLPSALGTRVQVSPSDYGVVPVTGTLAAMTEDRIILSRDTAEFGNLHVHFPRSGYSLKAG